MAGKSTISLTFKISDDADGLKKLTMDADSFRKTMKEAVKVSTELQNNFINFAALSTSVRNFSDSMNQVVGTLTDLTSESVGFSKAMREANTMAGKDAAGFKQLKGEVAELAKEIPIARDLLANGLYQTISNGVPEDNWIEYLKTSARSAVGGLADINKVVGVTSTVIKNYGLEWSAAADIQDKIQLTAKNGVTSFEQLAQALPRVTANAATLGVSIDELLGTFATLTGVSGNTAEVSTQLAAIFTALVKPSSEAAEMAAQMGIQFDAAAIKAAGGFQNFLAQLDRSVKAYAQASGILEQEVYGKLLGSAESLRAIIPLQGELADKFAENVSNMVNSAGTMDAAFEEMGSTGAATAQKLKNSWATVIDSISGFTSGAQPFVNFGAGLLSSLSSIFILIEGLKKFNVQAKITAKGIAALGKVENVIRQFRAMAVGLKMLAVSGGNAAAAAAALRIALRGLLISTGIGAAIWGITEIIGHFISASDKATESAEKLNDATDDYTRAAADAKVQIDRDIKALGDLIKAKKDTREAIRRLNETYGELFGTHSTDVEWYNILTEKSRQYIKQIGYEAQAKALASKAAEASINKELAAERKAELERAGKHKVKLTPTAGSSVTGYLQTYTAEVETEEYKQAKEDMAKAAATEAELQKRLDTISELAKKNSEEIEKGLSESNSEIKVSEMTWLQCAKAIEKNATALKNTTDPKRIRELKAQNALLEARMKALAITPETRTNLEAPAPAGSLADVNNRISDVNAKIQLAVDDESRIKLYKELQDLEEKKRIIEFRVNYLTGKGNGPDNPALVGKDRNPLKDVTEVVDIDKLGEITPSLEYVGKYFRWVGQQAKAGMGEAASAVADLAGSFAGLGTALELPELNAAGTIAQAIANMVLAYSQALAQASELGPWAWIGFGAAGLAQLGATISAVKGMAKFADGGIVSGPTVGLIGEYAGASNNPEVVAPLDKLRGMLNPVGEPVIIGGTLRASGRELVCVLANETRIASKSGRKTNIKI